MSVKVIPPGGERPIEPDEVKIEVATAIDWQLVRASLLGRETAIPRAQAVALVAASNRPDAHRDLERLLKNPSEPARLRALAALSLVRLPSPAVADILTDATADKDEQVLAAVMRALGRVGGERALRAIESATHATGTAARQAVFAAAVITHRLGLDGHDLPVPGPDDLQQLPDAAARPFRMQFLTGSDTDDALASLAREGFLIEYDRGAMHEIRCDDNRWLLAFNREVTTSDGVARMRDRKSLAGVWASYQQENRTFSARFLMFTAPEAKGAFRIHMHRLTGEAAFFGRGEIHGERNPFSIRAVRAPGAFPMILEGQFLVGGRFQLTTARAGLFVPETRQPQQSRTSR